MIKVKAFSLLEVIITLGISCSLLLIGSLELKSYQEDLILNNTIKQTLLALDQGSRISTLNRTEVSVSYLPHSKKLVLLGRNFTRQIDIDPSVQIKNLNNFSISKNGIISPRTLTFMNKRKTKQVRIQMAWGRVVYED